MTLAYEISNGILIILLNFKYLDSYLTFPPFSLKNDTVSSFWNLFAQSKLFKRNLHWIIKSSGIEWFLQIKFTLFICL